MLSLTLAENLPLKKGPAIYAEPFSSSRSFQYLKALVG